MAHSKNRHFSMIYKGNNSSIELDIVSDLNEWAFNILMKEGFKNVSVERALQEYCNMELRLLTTKPRKVLVSKELIVPEAIKNEYRFFKETCETGKPLLPFMSKTILDVNYLDKMIFDWGFFHFHLSTSVDAKDSRFWKRSGIILIAYVDLNHDDQIYFLQIRPHISSVWTEQELVRILVDNWPDTMESRRLKGTGTVSLIQNVTDQDYKNLRKHNVNTMVDLHDGRVYMGANLGLNSAGTSVKAVIHRDNYVRNAQQFQQMMGKSVDSIVNTINKKLLEPVQYFKLNMITPGNSDYLFRVENYDFFLRYLVNKNGKCIIAVGDTEEQIEEKLQLHSFHD